MRLLNSWWFPALLGVIILAVILKQTIFASAEPTRVQSPFPEDETGWRAPDMSLLANNEEGNLVRYGHALVANTSLYLGPKGRVAALTNGMNCQNCHIDAGLKSFGNCFSGVASTYPKYRDRSGKIESIEFRVKECMERSLNGTSVDDSSREMKAMVAYLKWLGKDVPKGEKPIGSGLVDLPYMDRAADPEKGKAVFLNKCQSCHGADGQGTWNHDSSFYIYPPLWGPNSYNVSAGQYRLTRFASYVKDNMPFGSSHASPQLTNEEAWDVAAFVNSQPRPDKKFAYDWPKLESKPVDYPFGPYSDAFSEKQHKYGPYKPIIEAKKKMNNKK
jgi:thiosulfate dehydrogenase